MSDGMWSVYLLRCADGTLYCGCTTDVKRRVDEHNAGICGARYTVGRRPVRLVWSWPAGTQSDAQKLEAKIKKLPRAKKEAMIRARSLAALPF